MSTDKRTARLHVLDGSVANNKQNDSTNVCRRQIMPATKSKKNAFNDISVPYIGENLLFFHAPLNCA